MELKELLRIKHGDTYDFELAPAISGELATIAAIHAEHTT